MNDPVKHCKLYKEIGCSHVDGMLCDFPKCSMSKEYEESKLKIKFGNTGSGDWLEVNEDSKANDACLIYNESISDYKFVIYADEIDTLIAALNAAKEVLND